MIMITITMVKHHCIMHNYELFILTKQGAQLFNAIKAISLIQAV